MTPRNAAKTAPKTASKRPEWPEVLKALPGDSDRQTIVAKLRGAGFEVDDFRTSPVARALVSHGLTSLEDALEYAAIDAGGSGRGRRREALTAQRRAIQSVRKVLELEIV
jgi:hypothetical protein